MVTQNSFTFPFKDPKWGNKALVGSLLTLAGYVIPIIPTLFVLGYIVRLMRHTIDTGEAALPEWDEWGDLGLKGLYYLIVYLVYLLPGVILLTSAVMTFFAGSFVSGLREAGDVGQGPRPWFGTFGAVSTLMAVSMFLLSLLALLAGWLAAPVALARLAATDSLAAAFELDRIWRIVRAELGDLALAWALSLGLSYAMGMVVAVLYYTVCLCLLVPFISAPFSFYKRVFRMTLFAQIYRRGTLLRPAAPLPTTPAAPPPAGPPETDGPVPTAEEIEVTGAPARLGEAASTESTPASSVQAPERPAQPLLSPYELSLGELGLPARVQDTLMDAGFVTVGHVLDALRIGEGRLLEVKGFGPRSLDTLKARLHDLGFID
jgi:hypothetical protein